MSTVDSAAAAVVCGLGAYVPERAVTNAELASELNVTEEWIHRRTGIHRRHVSAVGETTSDLAVEAGARALSSAGSGLADALLLATSTPDYQIPASAPAVAARLGLSGVAAFDINAVCSGFVYALAVGAGMIAGGLADRVLVIGADQFSGLLRPDDQVIRPLFGDGAGAVVLRSGRADEQGALTAFDLGSEGELDELLYLPGGGARQRARESGPQQQAEGYYLEMDGRAVFVNAVRRMAESSRRVLERVGRTPAEVDRVVGHQANVRVLRAVADQLDLPEERLVVNLDVVGNTSAASIPLALAHGAAAERLEPGQFVLLTAFGAGLTWGSAVLEWPSIKEVGA
jgi:3-oxoacyl-[acyl-carrier-protein] synthase-3